MFTGHKAAAYWYAPASPYEAFNFASSTAASACRPKAASSQRFRQYRCQRPSLRRHHPIPRRPRPNKPSVAGSGTAVELTLVA
jgi:hypothetical protein